MLIKPITYHQAPHRKMLFGTWLRSTIGLAPLQYRDVEDVGPISGFRLQEVWQHAQKRFDILEVCKRPTICFTICLFISPDLDGHRAQYCHDTVGAIHDMFHDPFTRYLSLIFYALEGKPACTKPGLYQA